MEIYLLDEKIELSDGRVMYSKLKSDFRKEAKIASDEFFDNYYNEMPNIDIYINKVEEYGLRCIENAFFNCSNLFISLGMFDFSPDFMFEDIKNGEGYFAEFLDELFLSKVNDIVLQHQREESYRSFRKDNRTEMVMVGGGSGVTGALTGMFKAGVVNMVSGAAHSAMNSIESKRSEQNLLEELNDLFFFEKKQKSSFIFNYVRR